MQFLDKLLEQQRNRQQQFSPAESDAITPRSPARLFGSFAGFGVLGSHRSVSF